MIRTFQAGLLLGVPVFFLYPFLNLLPRYLPDLSIYVTWAILFVLVIVRAISSNLCFSAGAQRTQHTHNTTHSTQHTL